jgi:hypothetical protein
MNGFPNALRCWDIHSKTKRWPFHPIFLRCFTHLQER